MFLIGRETNTSKLARQFVSIPKNKFFSGGGGETIEKVKGTVL